ncbi:MAG: hypothetical protein WCD21_40940, partial [Streptomyces sp.]
VAFEHPTALALTAHLLDRLFYPADAPDAAGPSAPADGAGPGEAGDPDGMDELDDDELLRQLEAEISGTALGFEEN